MHCPVCSSKETKVVDSRVSQDGLIVRRRRECTKCTYRFSTNEEMELLDIVVIKTDGRRESYDRKKLMAGIHHSLTKRAHTQESLDKLLHLIERDLQKKKRREIKTEEIGEIVMRHLKKFDKVGYIRFASIYRSFEDVSTFRKEIRSLERPKSARSNRKKKS